MMKLKDIGFTRSIPEAELPDLVLFDTTKQQTRLARKGHIVTIELEDKESGDVKIYPVEGTNIALNDHKDRTGLVDIGDRKNWLYSKRLFLDEDDIKRQIQIRLEGDVKS